MVGTPALVCPMSVLLALLSVEKFGYPAYRVEVKDCSKVENLCAAKFVLGIFMWHLLVVLYSLVSWWNQPQLILQTGIAFRHEPVIIWKIKEPFNTGLHVWVLGFRVWILLEVLGYIHHSFASCQFCHLQMFHAFSGICYCELYQTLDKPMWYMWNSMNSSCII
jgi:hypothetical protein